jgi:large subunit ribosomal protein L29
MNKEVEQLNSKTNDELCALITRLNSQLLESRFKMAVGEVEKTHVVQQIRKTIARCMYILNTRGYTITIGSHGIYLISKKDNKSENVTNKVQKILSQPEAEAKKTTKLESKKPVEAEVEAKKETKKVAKKEAKAPAASTKEAK